MKSLTIKNLVPGLPERGKIKIGVKGDERPKKEGGTFQLPVKIDHFIVTTLERGKDNNFILDAAMHSQLGEKPTEIPVRLLYDDIGLNFPSRYAKYDGARLVGTSDGETARLLMSDGTWKEQPWPEDFDLYKQTGNSRWRINATLSVMIDGAGAVGGVWKFRTTSYNSVVGILSSLTLIKRVTGGALAGLPLMLTLRPKTCATPDGKSTKVFVAGLEFRGTMTALRETGLNIMLENSKHSAMIERVEDEARKLIARDATDFGTDEEVVHEFAPEEVAANPADLEENGMVTGGALPEPARDNGAPAAVEHAAAAPAAADAAANAVSQEKPAAKRGRPAAPKAVEPAAPPAEPAAQPPVAPAAPAAPATPAPVKPAAKPAAPVTVKGDLF